MDRLASLGRLDPQDWSRLQDLVNRFETAWQQARPGAAAPELAAYVPGKGDALRLLALHELIKSDLEARCRRRLPAELEQYLGRYPELGRPAEVPASVIYEEYRARHMFGDRPALAGYQKRFPAQYAELELLVREQPPPTLRGGEATPAGGPAAVGAGSSAAMATAGEYKLLKRIGSGGFGEVWQAEAPGGVPVAVKIIFRPLDHDEVRREFEALELIKRLRHPFLLQTQAFFPQEDRLRIVMELADGSLRDRLKECRAQGKEGLPVEELLAYFRQAAQALDYLHAQHVLHRDIKPENLLVLNGFAKVADFGLARLQQSQRSATASGSGTPAYMAPEVWRGKVSVHGDQYSLAVAYAELRLGRRPYAGADMMELMVNHLQNPPDLAGLPEAEQRVLERALAKEPAGRFGCCQEFVDALEQAVLGSRRAATGVPAALPTPLRPAAGPAAAMETLGKEARAPAWRTGSSHAASATDPLSSVPAAPARQATDWRKPPAPAPAKSAPGRGRRSVVLGVSVVGGLLAAGLAALAWHGLRPAGSFTLGDPAGQMVRAGERATFKLGVKRERFDGPVAVSFADGPAGVTIRDAIIPAGADEVPVELAAAADAAPGDYEVKVRATGSGERQEKKLALTVLASNLYRPTSLKGLGRWEPRTSPTQEPVRVGDLVLASALDFVFDDDQSRAEFVLIPPGGDSQPAFYIMKYKVSNRLFKKFAATHRTVNGDWRKGALAADKFLGIDGRDDYPVFGVAVEDASKFAHQWMGGDLPKPAQWDKAAGRWLEEHVRGPGPFRGPWQQNKTEKEVAVNLDETGPWPNGAARKDVSPFYEVHDLAGNGLEFTRRLFEIGGSDEELWMPFTPRQPGKCFVVLRGRGYNDPDPLLFSQLEDKTEGNSRRFSETSPYTSFRVVLEPY